MAERSSELDEIKKKLAEIDGKLNQLLRIQSGQLDRKEFVPSSLSSLPEHLRDTAIAVATVGQSTAEQVAAKTGRTRAAESDYLNQLASRGFLKKERRGRKVHFLVFSLYAQCSQCGARVLMTMDHCPMCKASLSKEQ